MQTSILSMVSAWVKKIRTACFHPNRRMSVTPLKDVKLQAKGGQQNKVGRCTFWQGPYSERWILTVTIQQYAKFNMVDGQHMGQNKDPISFLIEVCHSHP